MSFAFASLHRNIHIYATFGLVKSVCLAAVLDQDSPLCWAVQVKQHTFVLVLDALMKEMAKPSSEE